MDQSIGEPDSVRHLWAKQTVKVSPNHPQRAALGPNPDRVMALIGRVPNVVH